VATEVFLFTDIEGSTKLWSDHPGLIPEIRGRHDDVAAFLLAEVADL
jgi:hypothetical protein